MTKFGKLLWLEDQHFDNFVKLAEKVGTDGFTGIPRIYFEDYAAACYILSVPKYFNLLKDNYFRLGINIPQLLKDNEDKEDFVSPLKDGDRWIIEVAQHLFNGEGNPSLWGYLNLDRQLYRVYLQALDIRREI